EEHVGGDGEVRDWVVLGVARDEHDRVRVAKTLALRDRSVVRSEDEDVRRVGEQEAVLLRERRLRAGIEPLVRVADAAREREVARHRPRYEEDDEGEQPEQDDSPPGRAPRRSETEGRGAAEAHAALAEPRPARSASLPRPRGHLS